LYTCRSLRWLVIENLRRVFSAHKAARRLYVYNHHNINNITQYYKHSGRQFVCVLYLSIYFHYYYYYYVILYAWCTRSTYILPYYRCNIDRRMPMRVILYILCPVGYGCVANNYALQDKYCAFIVVVFCFGFYFSTIGV